MTVSTTNDGADEPDGSVSVGADAGHGYTVSPAQGSTSVRVLDNDDPLTPNLPEVSLVGYASITEGEHPGFLEFHAELSRASEEDATVRYEVCPGMAQPHLDYSGGYSRVEVYAGRTQGSLIVRVRDDTRREAHEETLSVVLTEAEGAVIAPDEHTATGTIVAND